MDSRERLELFKAVEGVFKIHVNFWLTLRHKF